MVAAEEPTALLERTVCQTGSPETPPSCREQRPLTAAASPFSARRHNSCKKQEINGRYNNSAADGLVAAAAAAAEKELAPVIIRPGFINSVEAFIVYKTAAAAAAAATSKPAHEAASRISRS